MADIAASTLAKLKNKAQDQGIQLEQLLTLFCQEEFLRRLSNSIYRDNLILKGGFLIYAISQFTGRPTRDADYLMKGYSNDIKAVMELVREIVGSPGGHDFIHFEIRDLEATSELRQYHGVRVNLAGVIGSTRTPFHIDIGVGDVVVPSVVPRTVPVVLPESEGPQVLTYSLESTIAEKADAIISLMEATGRMKDFYDIYYLATTFEYDGRELQEAIYETLSHRGTPYERDSVTSLSRLSKDSEILRRWKYFWDKSTPV